MTILSCSSTLSVFHSQPSALYSFMLPAPKEVKLLPPPRPRVEIERTSTRRPTRADLIRLFGPIQSRDDMHAELADIVHQTLSRMRTLAQVLGVEVAA